MSPETKSLRERNKEDKLARIEHAARRLFSKQGYDLTTTREIAERAGIGVGTLFVYFPEKRDI
jgi:AcrR family transcriptional regulator